MKQTFFLTGCASGIGKHLAGVLIERGHQVVATDVNFEALNDHAHSRNWSKEHVLLLKLDVTDASAWRNALQAAIDRFGSIDVLMNIAGYLKPGAFVEMDPVETHRHFDINVKGVVFGTQAAAKHMLKRGKGHIINVASMAGLAPIPGLSLYSASKYAVRSFSLAAAYELKPQGVFVTVLCPDGVNTPMLDLQRSSAEAALTFSGPRILTVENIAHVVEKRILPYKPLEVYIPLSRGIMARLGDVFPRLGFKIAPLLRKKGRKRQLNFRG